MAATAVTALPTPSRQLMTSVQVRTQSGDYVRLQVSADRMSFRFPLSADAKISLVSLFGSSNLIRKNSDAAIKLQEWMQKAQAKEG